MLTGYGVHINALTEEDVQERNIDLDGHELVECIAIHGEDMARELAYVVVPAPQMSLTPKVIWSAPDVRKLHATQAYNFATSVVNIVRSVLPEFDDLLKANTQT